MVGKEDSIKEVPGTKVIVPSVRRKVLKDVWLVYTTKAKTFDKFGTNQQKDAAPRDQRGASVASERSYQYHFVFISHSVVKRRGATQCPWALDSTGYPI